LVDGAGAQIDGFATRLMFAKLKVWRRIATRYDRFAHTFFSAICIPAAVVFWF
jgi:transposase